MDPCGRNGRTVEGLALFQDLLAQHRVRVVPAPLSSPGPLRGVPVLHSLLSHTPCERGLVPAPVWIGVPRVPPILDSLFQGLSSQVPSPLLPCTRGGVPLMAFLKAFLVFQKKAKPDQYCRTMAATNLFLGLINFLKVVLYRYAGVYALKG